MASSNKWPAIFSEDEMLNTDLAEDERVLEYQPSRLLTIHDARFELDKKKNSQANNRMNISNMREPAATNVRSPLTSAPYKNPVEQN